MKENPTFGGNSFAVIRAKGRAEERTRDNLSGEGKGPERDLSVLCPWGEVPTFTSENSSQVAKGDAPVLCEGRGPQRLIGRVNKRPGDNLSNCARRVLEKTLKGEDGGCPDGEVWEIGNAAEIAGELIELRD